MLFTALLLIACVYASSGGPLEKGIHLAVPTFPRKNTSWLRPGLVFGESMTRSRRSDSLTLAEGVKSLLNPGVEDVRKTHTGRELKSSEYPTPANMNTTVPDNGTGEHKTTRLSRHRNHDLQAKRKGNGFEDTTSVDGHDLTHYDMPLGERADTVINDTVEHLRIQNFEESPVIHENGPIRDADDLKMAKISDGIFPSDHVFVTEKEKSNKSGIHFKTDESTTISKTKTDIFGMELTLEHKEGFQSNFFSESVLKVPETESEHKFNKEIPKYETNKEVNTTFRPVLNVIAKNYSDISNSSTDHKSTLIDIENKRVLVSNKQTSNESLILRSYENQIKPSEFIPMQQDSAYEGFTTSSNKAFLESGERKLNEDSSQPNEEFIKTILPNAMQASAVTTPDSHMNDPPFRGPNVPQEIDHFQREKDDTKINYRNPSTTSGSPLSQSLNIGGEWKHAMQKWGLAWDCHCYITGSLFAIIAFYSFISLLRAKTFITLLSTGYYTITNLIIFLLCLMRAFYLLYDPYNLAGKYPKYISRLLLKITLPCLTSTFSLLVLALLNYTQTLFLSPKFQRPFTLGMVITFIFSIFVTLEILAGIMNVSSLALLACYLVIISCAGLSSMCYFFVFKKLHHRALRRQGEMIRLTFTKLHIDGAQLPKKLPKPTLSLAVKLVLVSAILQLLLCFLSPYAVVFLQGLFPNTTIRNPWFWWGYQLTCRILELLMCATMSFVVTQPLKHYEIGDGKFCSMLMWFPCSSFSECFQRQDIVDFESHSDNYANPQGLRRDGFNVNANSRRLQTNSLPTFRTPLTEVDTNIPMRTLPCSGRHTNYTSALSLLSYYRSKRTLSLSTNEGLEDLERTLCSQTASSDGRNSLRPASMLYKDNGFIRFRRETDPEQPMEMSDEDERTQEEIDTSLEDADSTKANVGSSFHSLLEGDIVQNTLSPFFQIGYKRRFRKMSRISIETTDYSADISSDQLSNVVNLRNGLSSSALDFHTRKYGSTCSSESAANSFDVTFFLNSASSPEMQTSPNSTTPASLNICSAYRSETEDDKTSSVEGHEVMLRSVSPIVTRASSGRLSLNLNLHAATDTNLSNGHVNVACGTEDITPDSAVYLDLHLSRENTISPHKSFPSNHHLPQQLSPGESFTKSTDGINPLTPESASESSNSPTSQSLSELRTSNSYVVPRARKNSRGLLCKLRGSTFSLNASFYGYEPLEQVNTKKSKRLFERSSRPLSEGQLEMESSLTNLGEFWQRATVSGSGHLGDSGLLGDCGVALVDTASQTEDTELKECPNKHCKHFTENCTGTESQTLIATQLVKLRK